MELETKNFKIDSSNWKVVEFLTPESLIKWKYNRNSNLKWKFKMNKTKDIFEPLFWDFKGEQFFTYEAAIRETSKLNKTIPTEKQFIEFFKKWFPYKWGDYLWTFNKKEVPDDIINWWIAWTFEKKVI